MALDALNEKDLSPDLRKVLEQFQENCFNYYVSVARDMDFRKRFSEMTLISLGVAALSFGVGRVLGKVLGVEVG